MTLLAVLALTALLFPNLVDRLPVAYFLLPDSEIEITLPVENHPSGEPQVEFHFLTTELGNVIYSNLDITGEHNILPGRIVFSPNQQVRIRWQGKLGYEAQVAFSTSAFPQEIEINWNGEKELAELSGHEYDVVEFHLDFQVLFTHQLPFLAGFSIVIFGTILAGALLLGRVDFSDIRQINNRKWGWLAYMLPMLAAWGFMLLVFWPGILSLDSLNQMRQALTGEYNDWHPVFHTLMIDLLLRVWASPAVVMVAQIIFLALTAAWGCGLLREAGVPSGVTWLLALGFAALPVNAIMVVTLWKDVAYSIAFLWFTLLILRLVLTQGQAAASWKFQAALALSAFLVAIIRANGLPVAFGALVMLVLVYRTWSRPLVVSSLAALLVFLGVRGPLYGWLDVNRNSSGQFNLPLLHHIAAHVEAGTPLEKKESDYLNGLLPLEKWDYWCCYVGSVSQDSRFDRGSFLNNTRRNLDLALDLFIRAPDVNIHHAICAGELVWRFNQKECPSKSVSGIINWEEGQEQWVRKNDLGIKEQPLLPGFIQPILKIYKQLGFDVIMLKWYLLPAFSLFISSFSLLVAAQRRADARFWLVGLPVIIQASVLFALSLATIYRYHYGTVIAAIFIAGLVFLPGQKKTSKNKK